MATKIETDPSLRNGPLPDDAGDIIRTAQWGIDNTLSGFIIQDAAIQSERITDTTQDQKGAVVSQLDYDEHFTLTLNVIGGDGSEDGTVDGIELGDIDFTWAGKKWKVNGVQYQGNYQDKKKYTITAERWTHFPATT